MKVLLTNDDGIQALGLNAMRRALRVPVVDVVRDGPSVLWQAVCPAR